MMLIPKPESVKLYDSEGAVNTMYDLYVQFYRQWSHVVLGCDRRRSKFNFIAGRCSSASISLEYRKQISNRSRGYASPL